MNQPISPAALADLAAGGTEPAEAVEPTPTSRVVASLRALADLLEAHGDMGKHEALMPYIDANSTSAGMGGAVLRAMVRAEEAGRCTVRRYHWRPTPTGRAREVYGLFQGIWIKTTEAVRRPICGHCDGTGIAPEPEPMAGDGAEPCAACGGAS